MIFLKLTNIESGHFLFMKKGEEKRYKSWGEDWIQGYSYVFFGNEVKRSFYKTLLVEEWSIEEVSFCGYTEY
jgi:hypothetical protein